MSDFWLKLRDTLPTIEITLLDPDGTVHDLTGATGAKLHIRLSNGTTATKSATIYNPSGGVIRYTFLSTDWTDLTAPLIAGTHRMEVEVTGPGAGRLTWPNDGYDALRIVDDLGQG
jgi:hypothetical protein